MKTGNTVSRLKDIIDKSPKLNWVFYPYLARRKLTALTSQTGKGKSYLATWWAIKLAHKYKVLYIDTYMDKLTSVRIDRFYGNKDNLKYTKHFFKERTFEDILEDIKSKEYDVVIIDALQFIVFNGKQNEILTKIKSAAYAGNCAVLLLFNAFGKDDIPLINLNNKSEEVLNTHFISMLKIVSYKEVRFKNLFQCFSRVTNAGRYNISIKFYESTVRFEAFKECKYTPDIFDYSLFCV